MRLLYFKSTCKIYPILQNKNNFQKNFQQKFKQNHKTQKFQLENFLKVVQEFNIEKSLSKWTLFKDFESKLQFQAFI